MKWTSFGCKLTAVLAGLLLFGMTGGAALAYPPPTGSATMTLSGTSPTVGSTISVSTTVVNQSGIPRSNLACTFEILSQPGTDASIDTTPVRTDLQGTATASLMVGSTPGALVVGATCGEVTSQVEVEVTGTAAAPAAPELPAAPAAAPAPAASLNLPATGTGPAETAPSGLLMALLAGGLLFVGFGSAVRIVSRRSR